MSDRVSQLDRMAETLLDIGYVSSAQVVDQLGATEKAVGFVSKDQRRRELEQMRSEVGGGRRIARIFDADLHRDDREIFIPGSFVQAMIDEIVRREFPEPF